MTACVQGSRVPSSDYYEETEIHIFLFWHMWHCCLAEKSRISRSGGQRSCVKSRIAMAPGDRTNEATIAGVVVERCRRVIVVDNRGEVCKSTDQTLLQLEISDTGFGRAGGNYDEI